MVMGPKRRMILLLWGAAALIGLILILATHRSGQDGNLAKDIVGIWQATGSEEVDQFRDDGTVLIQGAGRSGVCCYAVLDGHRLQVTADQVPGQPTRAY